MDAVPLKETISQIRSLRSAMRRHEDVLQSFLSVVAQLTDSPWVVIMSCRASEGWQVDASLDAHHLLNIEPLVASLNHLAPRFVQNQYAFEPWRHAVGLSCKKPMLVSILLDFSQPYDSRCLCLLLDKSNVQKFNECIARLLLVSDIASQPLEVHDDEEVVKGGREAFMALELLALTVNQKKFELACMTLVNELASRVDCIQVSLGWMKDNEYHVTAVSHVERIESTTDVVQQLLAVYEEAADQDTEIVWPMQEDVGHIIVSHKKYVQQHGLKEIVSLPLRFEGQCVGVLCCERLDKTFSDQELLALRLVSNQLTSWLYHLQHKDQWFFYRFKSWCRTQVGHFLGPERTWLKLAGCMVSVMLMYITFASHTYKVDATATVVTDHIAYLSAPFNGFVEDIRIRAGEPVEQGDLLLQMDREELYLKESEILADMGRYKREAEKAMAARNYVDQRISMARVEQAKAALSRVHYYLSKAVLHAPFSGVVVEGERSQLLGSPVTKGDVLIKLAQIKELYVRLSIGEEDIDEVQVGSRVGFVLLSKPGEMLYLIVTQIIPVAKVAAGSGNMFTVNAMFESDVQRWWRPGMSGVAEVHAGQRSILWIMTHRMTDQLRLFFW